jgi:hypothetical protein
MDFWTVIRGEQPMAISKALQELENTNGVSALSAECLLHRSVFRNPGIVDHNR